MAHFLTRDSVATLLLHRLCLCCGLLLAMGIPRAADAFVLGELQRIDKPGQPFHAIAPITLDPGEEIVTIEMGETPDYRLLNLTRKTIVDHITVQMKKEADRLLVAMQSTAPIQENDFHILLRVSSNHHTYFPFFHLASQARNDPNQASQEGSHPQATPIETTQTDHSPPRHTDNKKRTYGPVRSKDGLGGIARRFQKGSDASVSQVAVAIWHQNPGHFIRNNMNGLKTGGTLLIPEPEEMTRLNKQEASALMDAHAAEWKKPPKQRLTAMPSLPMTATETTPVAPTKEVKSVKSMPSSTQERDESVKQEAHPKTDMTVSTEPAKEVVQAAPTEPAKKTADTTPTEPAKKMAETAPTEPAEETTETARTEPARKEADSSPKEQVKVESGALKAILVQLQVITRVLENHHDRQEQLEKRVANLEKNQEQRDQLEKRVSMLERAMQEWNFLTKGRSANTENDKK